MSLDVKILIVEDEAIIAADIKSQVESLGYNVIGVTDNSIDAFEVSRSKRPDLILMDIQIRGEIDGISTAHKVSSELDIPIVFLTAHADEHTLFRAKEVQPFGYLLKPFNDEDLNTTIQVALTRYELNVKLKRNNRDLQTFNQSVSHDLNAPLRRIVSFCEQYQELNLTSVPPEAQNIIENIHFCAIEAQNLIQSLLQLAQVSEKQVELAPISLNQLVKETLEKLNCRRLKIDLYHLPKVMGDKNLLKQALENLFSNAIKFTSKKSNPTIEIDCIEEGENVVCHIQDNGIGFDRQKNHLLFKSFSRLHNGEFKGTGVGLSIVKRIIDLHGGRVWAESEPNNGAVFYFSLKRVFE